MRILHLVSSHRWTGAAEPAADLALAQLRLGHDVSLACIAGESFWRRLHRMGVPPMEGLDLRTGPRPAILSDVLKLRKIVSEKPYDVVHCHLQHDHWIAAVALGRLTGKKPGADSNPLLRPILVRTFHRDIPPRGDLFHRRLYRDASDLLITVSKSALDSTREKLGLDGKFSSHAVWIRGAVDLERFHPGLDGLANRDDWDIPRDAAVAGIVARMQPHRRHLDLIETIDEVVARIPKAYYIIAGRGELKHKIRETIHAHPLSERLVRVGYRKHDLPETYAAMDVSVLLAQGSDGTCRAMLEAMACARPVIGANIGAMADTIEPGKTGWLVDPADRRQLVDALLDALGNLERTREMGIEARRRMEANFSQRARAEATIEAYGQSVARRGP